MKPKKLTMMLAITFTAAMPLMADEWYDSSTGYTWTYRINGDTAEIYGNYFDSVSVLRRPTGALVIPSELGGKAVTSIGDWAFKGCIGLTSVRIPDSVTSIGDQAFNSCSELTSVTIPDSVTSIGGSAFSGCNDSLFDTNTISGVKLVDGWVVGYTDSLSGSLDLTGARGIGDWAFYGCSGLTSVTIPDNVTSIGDWAFYGCSGLTSVTIPDNVTSIGYEAFHGCSGLTSITIPDSVTSIERNAFSGCNDSLFDTNTIPGVELVDGWAVGHTGSFSGSLDLTCARGIGDWAFSSCSGITNVTIPDSVTSIGYQAFSGCSGLTNVTIPDSVTSIGYQAFSGCSGLTSVTIPDSVTSIDSSAFYGCNGLQSFVVSPGNSVYTSESGFLLSKDGKTLIAAPGGLTSVTIPDSVTSIGNLAFGDCSGLASVTIPNSVTNIGNYAFYGCISLTSVTIPDSVTSIGESAFYGCISLTSVTIPDSVTSIGESAFWGCRGLTSMTIGSNVTSIGDYAFSWCESLKNITIPDSVTGIGNSAFSGCSGLTSVTIGSSVTSIGDYAFRWCESLKSITIPDSVTSIGEYAFSGCSKLSGVTIPKSVEYIGEGAFTSCKKMTKITLPTWCKRVKVYTYYVYYYDGEFEERRFTTDESIGDKQSSWNAYLGLSSKAKITYEDVITIPEAWQKAQTLTGVAVQNDDGALLGMFELKCGKANKKGIAKVSATLTGLDGKKKSYKSQSVDVTGEDKVEVNFNGLSIVIDSKGGSFRGEGDLNGGFYVESAEIGGNWTRTDARAYVDFNGDNPLPDGTIVDLLPTYEGEPVLLKGGKWSFNKAASVKLSKDKTMVEWDTSKDKSNLSAMKLTYTPKTGLFKGSFTVYALEESKGGKKKLNKYKANVTGVVLDGVGYGQATVKKPVGGPWIVTVE